MAIKTVTVIFKKSVILFAPLFLAMYDGASEKVAFFFNFFIILAEKHYYRHGLYKHRSLILVFSWHHTAEHIMKTQPVILWRFT